MCQVEIPPRLCSATPRWLPGTGRGESTHTRQMIYCAHRSPSSSPAELLWHVCEQATVPVFYTCPVARVLLWAWRWGETVSCPGQVTVTKGNDGPTSRVAVKTLGVGGGGGCANLKEVCHPRASVTPTAGQRSPGLSANSASDARHLAVTAPASRDSASPHGGQSDP